MLSRAQGDADNGMNFGMLDGEWKSCLAGSRTRECAY